MAIRVRPHSPSQRIIDTLLRNGPMTTSQLVLELGVTATAVGAQLARLESEGVVSHDQRRGGPGRPANLYSLSDKGRRTLGGQFDELSRLLIEELVRSDGPGKTRELLRRVGRRMADDVRSQVGNGPTADRLARLSLLLEREGMVVETSRQDDGVRLTVFNCPYPGLADDHREICEMERETVSDLVGGEVELDRCMVDGDRCCEFRAPAGRSEPRP
jgi:predicted ArsR family transcriptional regulator